MECVAGSQDRRRSELQVLGGERMRGERDAASAGDRDASSKRCGSPASV
jgi:hypothetical protein